MNNNVTRRQFIVRAALGVAGAISLPKLIRAQALPSVPAGPKIWVVHGKNISQMLSAGIKKAGGWGALVKPGGRVTLKVNAAWASLPEQGGNTNPVMVEEFIRQCRAAGAKEILLPENPCSPAKESFERSGIRKVVESAGGKLYQPSREQYRQVDIPKGISLKQADVACDVLDAECLINMPVAKSHGGSVLTIAMKNWMGSVRDRGFWHRNNLHQCIADLCTLIKPRLNIVDATRILLTGGPRGPGKMAYPDRIIFGIDSVAVDAYAATLFDKHPLDIKYIKLAHEMGIGCGDLNRVIIENVNI